QPPQHHRLIEEQRQYADETREEEPRTPELEWDAFWKQREVEQVRKGKRVHGKVGHDALAESRRIARRGAIAERDVERFAHSARGEKRNEHVLASGKKGAVGVIMN